MIGADVGPDGPGEACAGCAGGRGAPDIAMAFQAIIDVATGDVFANEALVRGSDGATAREVLDGVDDENVYAFDQRCRVRAIERASALDLQGLLSINFLPNAIYDPETCIRATVAAATTHDFPLEALMFEITEVEAVRSTSRLREIVTYYRSRGFTTAIDDFGAGHAGLNLLADFLPDIVKIDIGLVRGLHQDARRRAIVRAVVDLCQELGVGIIGEGVEELEEARVLRDLGVRFQQGFLYARPALDAVPSVSPAARALL